METHEFLTRSPTIITYNDVELALSDRRAYTSLYTGIYPRDTIIIKLIFLNDGVDGKDRALQNVRNEVQLQKKASKHQLGPTIYADGIYNPGDNVPFHMYKEHENNNTGDAERILFTCPESFYYIIMEHYSAGQGWMSHVHVHDAQLHPSLSNETLFYNFVTTLVTKAHIVNRYDPLEHVYYHPNKGLRMIDYGLCESCTKKQPECITRMCELLFITMPHNGSPARSSAPSKTRRSTNGSRYKNKNVSHRSPARSRSRSPARSKAPSKTRRVTRSPPRTRNKP